MLGSLKSHFSKCTDDTTQLKNIENTEMRDPHQDKYVEKILHWFLVNSLEHKLRRALTLEPTHTLSSFLLILGKAGHRPPLWPQTTLRELADRIQGPATV